MPVKFTSNNRVLNGNARATDVAKDTIDRIIDVQNRRYQEAFRVQGFKAILYYPLTSGTPCACKGKEHTVARILNEDGKAGPGFINELLTGETFGIAPYGVTKANMTANYPTDGSAGSTTNFTTSLYIDGVNPRTPPPTGWYDPAVNEGLEFDLDNDLAAKNFDRTGYSDEFGPDSQNSGSNKKFDDTLDHPTSAADTFSTTEQDPRARTIVPRELSALDRKNGGAFNVGGNSNEFEDLVGDYDNLNADAELDAQQRALNEDAVTTTQLAIRCLAMEVCCRLIYFTLLALCVLAPGTSVDTGFTTGGAT